MQTRGAHRPLTSADWIVAILVGALSMALLGGLQHVLTQPAPAAAQRAGEPRAEPFP
jgi:hypothetical protein